MQKASGGRFLQEGEPLQGAPPCCCQDEAPTPASSRQGQQALQTIMPAGHSKSLFSILATCGFLGNFFADCVKRTCHTSVCLRPFSLLSRKNMLKNPYISDTKQALRTFFQLWALPLSAALTSPSVRGTFPQKSPRLALCGERNTLSCQQCMKRYLILRRVFTNLLHHIDKNTLYNRDFLLYDSSW